MVSRRSTGFPPAAIDLPDLEGTLPPLTMRWLRYILVLPLICHPGSAHAASPAGARADLAGNPVDFASQIRPVLASKCYQCHGPDESSRKAKLRLDQREDALRELKGRRAIIPGDPGHSELVRRVTLHDGDEQMPPAESHNPVNAEEAALLSRWIRQGAVYSPHWAWMPPRRAPLPPVARRTWPRNGIDRFILSQLEARGLEPAPAADARTLARRVALDLTGLPLPPDELDRVAADLSPHAYERLVDRLLDSPHFGERWTRLWLDLGRYADSSGYGSDPLRPNIWPWRDWVIGALNRNLPFDEFTRDLLAGDLIEPGSDELRWATAFHRNTMTNTEGGTDDEEWRVAAVKDRTGVTMQVWMGLTFGCAQCHSHKFDPVTQKEYYQLFAFFNQTEDNDQPDERPTLPRYTAGETRRRAELLEKLHTLEARYNRTDEAFLAELESWTREASRPMAWTPLAPTSIQSSATNAATFAVDADGRIQAAGPSPARDTYTLTTPLGTGGAISALELEALPSPSMPGGGAGRRDPSGAFSLQHIHASLLRGSAATNPPITARFVRLEYPAQTGTHHRLMLAEVQVWSHGTNVALRQPARQSSTGYLGDASRAVDGNTDGNYGRSQSVSHTGDEPSPWWEVDLGRELPVDEVVVWNRTDGGSDQLLGAEVRLLNASRGDAWKRRLDAAPRPVVHLGPRARQALTLKNATATASNDGSGPEHALQPEDGGGWAPPARAQRAAIAFELAEPLTPDEGATLRLELRQTAGDRRTLGSFRILATRSAPPIRLWPDRIQHLLDTPAGQRTHADTGELIAFYKPLSKTLGPVARELAETRSEREAIHGTPVPVMKELPADQHRVTTVLFKGNYLVPGDPVAPGTPRAFHPLPPGAPTNRLGLAAWLTSRDNPLTARVQVNRVWAALFGRGLVETEEDFGTQGTLPSHPQLLDWLAVSYQTPRRVGAPGNEFDAPALGWDFKALLRLMVLSATYRQSAVATPEDLAADPQNRWLGRAHRRRLDAETLRDQALAVSGLLSRKIGGPSVFPSQPDGLWRAAFNGERSWSTSEGEDRYRRGIYTFWRRTVPYPGMVAFDAPSRESCTFRRVPTDTPLQAFVTLNDPVFVECAQALGQRLSRIPGTPASQIETGFRWTTGHVPSVTQVESLVRLFEEERVRYRNRPEDALRLATDPLGPLPPGLTPADAAAWTLIGNVLLNMDAVLTRG